MSRSPSFVGLILAAGESSRMGTEKGLLPWPPQAAGSSLESARSAHHDTFLSAAIRSFSLSTDFVIVIAGKNAPVLAPIVYANGASIVVNPDPGRGQFSSLQVGLQEVLNRGRDAAMITLVDRPPVKSSTLDVLRLAFETAPATAWAVVPEFSGQHGHPLLAGRELIEAFLRAPATSTARDVEHQHQEHIRYVAVNDPFVALNVNTPEDYAALIAGS